jgi:long-chain acyl-CoA synthetase
MLDLADRPPVATRPWLAEYDPGVPATLEYPAIRLDELLRRTAQRYPDRSALIFFGRKTTYRAIDDAVDRVARGLQRLGLAPGERVALFMPNCPRLVIAFYAIWRAGYVAVPANPRATGPELTRYLSDSGAAAAIVLDRLWPGVADARFPSSVRHLVVADVADELPLVLRIGARITARLTGSRRTRSVRRPRSSRSRR